MPGKKETYLEWLHELTTTLYEHKIFLHADREGEILAMYEHGKTIEQAAEILIAATK